MPVAETFWVRFKGLMGRRDLSSAFLFIPRCTSIHTCFMRGPIDVVFLDGANAVVGVHPAVRPWRLLFGPRTSSAVLELPSGYAREHALRNGDLIEWL